jgi:hypothetical protein
VRVTPIIVNASEPLVTDAAFSLRAMLKGPIWTTLLGLVGVFMALRQVKVAKEDVQPIDELNIPVWLATSSSYAAVTLP